MNVKHIEEVDDEATERTESINTVTVGGKFDIVLDVKKINTNKSIQNQINERE